MNHHFQFIGRTAAAAGICCAWIAGCGSTQTGSNQHEATHALLLSPITADQYATVVGDDTPKAAYLRTQLAARNQSVEVALEADTALANSSNPFRRSDPVTVANGAVIYAAHCALCHGADASGSGPGMPKGSPKMNFHEPSKRSLLRMTGRAPKSWITALREGATTKPKGHGEKPLVMPSFAPVLTNEQMWLAVTYLETIALDDSAANPAGAPK